MAGNILFTVGNTLLLLSCIESRPNNLNQTLLLILSEYVYDFNLKGDKDNWAPLELAIASGNI